MSFETPDVERGMCADDTSVIVQNEGDIFVVPDKKKDYSGYKILALVVLLVYFMVTVNPSVKNERDFISALQENSDEILVEIINRENFDVEMTFHVGDFYFHPLHLVAPRGHLKSIEALVKKGADVNFQISKGLTPLILSVSEQQLKVTEALLNAGANVDLQDIGGNTALIHAAVKNDTDLVELLLGRGANVFITNKKGFLLIICSIINQPN